MSYNQLKPFNQAAGGRVAGMCLQNVREGYGIAAKYQTAQLAWNGTQQHADTNIPTAVDVPLFYSYETDGHVNVQLANGQVWSDGNLYANVAAYESNHPEVHYLGWSESLNGVPVIQAVADPTPAPASSEPAGMPAVGSRIQLIPTQTRTTWKVGTASPAGSIEVTDNTFEYVVRGLDAKYPGRIVVNSASGGGNGVGLALYYLNGSIISGWKVV